MSTTRKPTPPTNQAEYTAWRAEQKRAEQAAKQTDDSDAWWTAAKAADRAAADRADAQRAAAAEHAAKRAAAAATEAKRTARRNARRAAREAASQAERDAADAHQAKWDANQRQWDEWYSRNTTRNPSPTRSKAQKAADLAASAYNIGSVAESYSAATRAGALYSKAGRTVADMAAECPAMHGCPDLWQRATAGFAGN
jgi:colicin import membrane protein